MISHRVFLNALERQLVTGRPITEPPRRHRCCMTDGSAVAGLAVPQPSLLSQAMPSSLIVRHLHTPVPPRVGSPMSLSKRYPMPPGGGYPVFLRPRHLETPAPQRVGCPVFLSKSSSIASRTGCPRHPLSGKSPSRIEGPNLSAAASSASHSPPSAHVSAIDSFNTVDPFISARVNTFLCSSKTLRNSCNHWAFSSVILLQACWLPTT